MKFRYPTGETRVTGKSAGRKQRKISEEPGEKAVLCPEHGRKSEDVGRSRAGTAPAFAGERSSAGFARAERPGNRTKNRRERQAPELRPLVRAKRFGKKAKDYKIKNRRSRESRETRCPAGAVLDMER